MVICSFVDLIGVQLSVVQFNRTKISLKPFAVAQYICLMASLEGRAKF